MRDISTVVLPRQMPPYARDDRRCSSKERSVRVAGFLRNFARSRRILALRYATVNSLSTCSSRFIRSTIAAVLLVTLVALIIAWDAASSGNELTLRNLPAGLDPPLVAADYSGWQRR